MNLIPDELLKYAEAHSTPEPPVLKELNRETHLKVLLPQMLSGHIQGGLLSLFSYMIHPRRILEVGTYTGYSAICLAAGLPKDGLLHTIDINKELEPMVRKYFEKAGVTHLIKFHVGNALDIIPTLDETFDLVFIDADKTNYSNYYELVFDKVRTGGFILVDNVLWSGKVLDEKKDKDTQAIDEFNKKVTADMRVENLLLPVRDGVMVARKLM